MSSAQIYVMCRIQEFFFFKQKTAYEILVSSKPDMSGAKKADIWDSGRVASEQSAGVPYAGPPLEAQKRYYWRVGGGGRGGEANSLCGTNWWGAPPLLPAAGEGERVRAAAPALHKT